MKKYSPLLIFFVLLIPVAIIFYRSPVADRLLTSPTPTPSETGIKLTDNWMDLGTEGNVIYKYQKQVGQGYRPQIAVVKSARPENIGEEKYLSDLIAGARSALPSYRVIKTSDGLINAYYYQGKQKIMLTQRIYSIGSNIYVLTGSYLPDQKVVEEINGIFDQVYAQKLK